MVHPAAVRREEAGLDWEGHPVVGDEGRRDLLVPDGEAVGPAEIDRTACRIDAEERRAG